MEFSFGNMTIGGYGLVHVECGGCVQGGVGCVKTGGVSFTALTGFTTILKMTEYVLFAVLNVVFYKFLSQMRGYAYY